MNKQLIAVNQPMKGPETGVFAFQRTGKRNKPYQLIAPQPVEFTAGEWPYRRTSERPFCEWQTPDWLSEYRELTGAQAQELIDRWRMRPLPIGPHNEAAYKLLEAEAARLQLPRSYQTDLTRIDRCELLRPDATRDFIWVLRTMGTFFLPLDRVRDSDGNTPPELVRAFHNADREQHWYRCAGGKLQEISYDKARELAEDALARHRQQAKSLGMIGHH